MWSRKSHVGFNIMGMTKIKNWERLISGTSNRNDKVFQCYQCGRRFICERTKGRSLRVPFTWVCTKECKKELSKRRPTMTGVRILKRVKYEMSEFDMRS